nr:MAG TPA: hypothetical protein [Caudoviricetes sp.]
MRYSVNHICNILGIPQIVNAFFTDFHIFTDFRKLIIYI